MRIAGNCLEMLPSRRRDWLGNIEGDFMRVAMVMMLMCGAAAQAAINNVSVSSPVNGTGVSLIYAAITESSCDAGVGCNRTQTITVPTGMDSYGAMISAYDMRFDDTNGSYISKMKLVLDVLSYNKSTGQLSFNLAANLDGNPLPTNKVFKFSVWFVIALGVDSRVKVGEYDLMTFSGNGPNGECDTTGACTGGGTLPDAGTVGGAIFQRSMLRGFDVSTISDAGIALSDIGFDVSSFAGNPAPSGAGSCSLLSNTSTENLNCSLYLTTVSRATGSLYPVQKSDSVLGASGYYYSSMNINSSGGSTVMSGGAVGLQSVGATPDSDIKFRMMQGGCDGWTFTASPTPSVLTPQTNYGLVQPGGGNNYDGTMKCVGFFVP
jgi:hypothetical protein